MYATITYKKPFGGLTLPGFLIIYFIVACKLVSGFLVWNSEIITGMLLAPYLLKIERGQLSMRFLLPAVLWITVCLFIPAKTPLFFALMFTVLLLVENSRGKVNAVFLILLLLCSPLFSYLTELAGFPIRLWLSSTLATILSAFGKTAAAAGNIVYLDGAEFSVDPACAGLNMLAISFIIALFMLSHRQRVINKKLGLADVVGLMMIAFALNILCNLLRILVLMLFNIPPANIFHDLVGLLCLLVYVVVPLYYIIKVIYKYRAKGSHDVVDERLLFTKSTTIRNVSLHVCLLLLICLTLFRVRPGLATNQAAYVVQLPGYQKNILPSGVVKLQNGNSLIYLKPSPFYGLAHDPMICWTGSGFVFKQVQQETLAGIAIYTGTLVKGKQKIYAAWWFDNGRIKTINQFNWRWRVIKGENDFYLVNVNAASQAVLMEKVGMMLARTE